MALGFLKNALGLVAKLTGIDEVGKKALATVQSLIGNDPKVQEALIAQELEFKRLAIQEGESVRKLFGLEVQSEDPFVPRARPAMLWLVFSILSMNYGVIPFISAVTIAFGGTVVEITYPEIPESVLALFGTIFAVYTGARSWDKRTKAKNGG